jgi:hypothetical protein
MLFRNLTGRVPVLAMKIKGFLAPAVFVMAAFSQAYAQNAPSSVALAPDPQSYLGARAAGRGGATVASQLAHDSLFQNPASAAFVKSYAVSVGYQALGNTLSASVVDTKSGPIGGGAFYLRRDVKASSTGVLDFNPALGDFARSEEHAGFSVLGQPAPALGVGANVRYSYLRSYDSRVQNQSGWNVDMGLRYMANDNLQIGLLGQGLLNDKTGILPRRYSAGAEFSASSMLVFSAQMFKVDPSSLIPSLALPDPLHTVGWSLGSELRFNKGVSVRAGYLSNPAWRQKLASVGAGWSSDTVRVDYAFQMGVGTKQDALHSIVVTGYF